MNKYFALLLFFLFFSFSFSQQVKVTGVIKDSETGQPLEYATLAIYNPSDNSVVTGGITDAEGKFSVPVQAGTYNFSFEFISFKKQFLNNKTVKTDTDLGVISLLADVEALQEVEIIAERTTVELHLDKKIYNVGKDLTVSGGTVSDVLDNVPSVSVDVEGNVALRGNENVTIFINGKPSGLVGLNSTEALRQLPAETIERVEIITSPSARYDAEGTAGIINIILRRSKLQGLNGAINANIGHPLQAGISGNINYRTGDFNFFNTTSLNYREAPGESTTETEYFNGDDPNTFVDEYRDFDRSQKGLTTNTGLEWYITDSASLTTSMVYSNSKDDDLTTNNIFLRDNLGNLTSNYTRLENEEEDDKNIQYNVNFDKQFNNNSQHKLTFDFQYENSTENEYSYIEDAIDERVATLEDQDRILLQTDYVHPFSENSQFEIGYRGNFRTQDIDYALEFEDLDTGDFVLNDSVSNNLIYKEYVNAIYSQYGTKIKEKFTFLLGLRLESTRITIDQVTSGDLEKRDYVDLFPTVNLGYEISENQSITLGYNRRISRPRSRFVNPFPSRSSATNLFQGNPNINPSYSNAFDIGYLNQMGKVTLNSSVYYQRETDAFTFISEDTGTTTIVGGEEVPVIRRTPINLATNDRYGFEFNVSFRQSKKWNVNGNINLFQSVTKGDYNGVTYDADNFSWFARINNKYTLPGQIDWQTRLNYRGPSEDAQNKRKGMFSCDLAFSKDFFDGNASVALNVSDVFNTRKRIMDSTTSSFESHSEFQWRKRSVNLSLTYRFNQKKRDDRQRNGDQNGGGDMDFEG